MERRLYRSNHERILGGVAGGLGEYLGIDPTVIRLVLALIFFATHGTIVFLYIVAWIVIPQEPSRSETIYDEPVGGGGADYGPSGEADTRELRSGAGVTGASTGESTGASIDGASGAAHSGESSDEIRDRMHRSAQEIVDTGARLAREAADSVRRWRSDLHSAEGRPGERSGHYSRDEGDGHGRRDMGATVFGLVLIGVGVVFFINQVFSQWFRLDIAIPTMLIVIGVAVMATGRRS